LAAVKFHTKVFRNGIFKDVDTRLVYGPTEPVIKPILVFFFMKQEIFKQIQDTLHSAEYVQIKSWLIRNEPTNPAIQEISKAVEHSYSPNPFNYQFSNEANETFCRVFLIIKKMQNEQPRNATR